MSLNTKRIIIAVLGLAFLGSLLMVQAMEVTRKRQEAGARGCAGAVTGEVEPDESVAEASRARMTWQR